MSREEAEEYLSEINKTRPVIPAKAGVQQSSELWILDQVENDKRGKTLRLRKRFKFNSYMAGVDFVNKVAKIAELEGHHPDIFLGWRRVTVNLMTHAIGGLSQNDFILASKIDKILAKT